MRRPAPLQRLAVSCCGRFSSTQHSTTVKGFALPKRRRCASAL